RHTRFSRDWSSDVCSSDLALEAYLRRAHAGAHHGETDISDLKETLDSNDAQHKARIRASNIINILNSSEFRSHSNMASYLFRKRSEERRVGKAGRSLQSPD